MRKSFGRLVLGASLALALALGLVASDDQHRTGEEVAAEMVGLASASADGEPQIYIDGEQVTGEMLYQLDWIVRTMEEAQELEVEGLRRDIANLRALADRCGDELSTADDVGPRPVSRAVTVADLRAPEPRARDVPGS